MPSKELPAMWIGAGLLAAAVAFVLARVDPSTTTLFARCPFLLFTGLYCPGCGTLRTLHQLLNGHFLDAWRYNPLLCVGVALAPLTWLRPELLRTANAGRIVVSVVLTFWFLRNVPVFPFTLLAPSGLMAPVFQVGTDSGLIVLP
jgi:hypothetical protein